MTQTLTEFFHSWGWETLILATTLFGSAIAVYLYYDLEGIMKKKNLFKIVALEMVLCSSYGFGDIVEMIKYAALPLVSAIIFGTLFRQLRESFDNAYF